MQLWFAFHNPKRCDLCASHHTIQVTNQPVLRIISCQWCVASLQLFPCQAFVCSLLGKTVLSFQLSSMSALTLCIISTLPCPNELPFTHSTVKPHILFPLQFQPSSCHPCPFFFLLLFIQEMQLLPHSIPVKPPFRATSISYIGGWLTHGQI